MVITATPSYDSFTLLVTDLTWYRDSNKSIVWGYKLLTGTEWHETSESVTGKPESMSHTFSNLMPGRTYQYRVAQYDDTMFEIRTYQVTTLSEIGELTADEVTTSSIKAKFEDYVPATYTRVAKFRYGRTPSAEEQKPTSYDCGQVVIPPNTTDKDVSTLITGLRNSTSYNVYMTLYKVTYSGGAQRLVYMADYSVTATTGIPSSEEPSVSIEKITKRYDTSNLTIDLHTDYPGLYRFVLLISDDANGTYWHTLVLPNLETEFYAKNILLWFRTEAIGQTPTYTQKDNVDIKVGIIVETDTENIADKGFTYTIGNAKDIRTPHTGLPEGMTLYGETTAVNVTFDETPILHYEVGDPCGVGANDIYTLANILYEKYDTLYRDYTEDDWMAFMRSNQSGRLRSKYEIHHIPLSTLTAQLEVWAEDIIHSLQDARVGSPVYAEGGTLLKSMEELAQDLTYGVVWTLDADPDEQVEALYFQKLSQFIHDTE